MLTYSTTKTLKNFGSEVSVERRMFDLSGDLAPAIRACCDDRHNRKAANLISWAADEFGDDLGCAVYAVEVVGDDFAKVGVTHSPNSRIAALQNAHYRPLRFHSLLWFDTSEQATLVEGLVLKAAREMEIHERGEWMATDATEVAMLSLKAARYAGAPCRDSKTALEDFANSRITLKAATSAAHRAKELDEIEIIGSRIRAS